MKKLNLVKLTGIALTTLATPLVAYADYPKVNLVQNTDPQTVAGKIVNFLLVLAGSLAVIFLIVGGIRYIISSGSPDGIEKAKKTITYAIIGIIVIILSYIIVAILNNAGSSI
jgi:hypothetical protein